MRTVPDAASGQSVGAQLSNAEASGDPAASGCRGDQTGHGGVSRAVCGGDGAGNFPGPLVPRTRERRCRVWWLTAGENFPSRPSPPDDARSGPRHGASRHVEPNGGLPGRCAPRPRWSTAALTFTPTARRWRGPAVQRSILGSPTDARGSPPPSEAGSDCPHQKHATAVLLRASARYSAGVCPVSLQNCCAACAWFFHPTARAMSRTE